MTGCVLGGGSFALRGAGSGGFGGVGSVGLDLAVGGHDGFRVGVGVGRRGGLKLEGVDGEGDVLWWERRMTLS